MKMSYQTAEFISVKEIINGATNETIDAVVNVDNIIKATYYPEVNQSQLWMSNGSRIVIKGDIMMWFSAVECE